MRGVLLGVLVFTLVSCGGESESLITGNEGSTVATQALSESREIQQFQARGEFCSACSAEDRASIERLFSSIQAELIILSYDQKNRPATLRLFNSLKQLENFPMLRRDKALIEDYLVKINEALMWSANLLGMNLSDYDWVMFEYAFSQGVYPFASYSSKTPWDTDWALDRPFVKVAGQDYQSWLLSPEFDLTEVVNPSIQFLHSFIINRNTGNSARGPYDRMSIIENAFQLYLLIDYQEGTDPELLPKEQKIQLDMFPWPDGFDFHAIWSPKIDLSPYRFKNVTIAFRYYQDTKLLGNHYLSWSVERFQFMGQGEGHSFYKARDKELWSEAISSDSLGVYTEITPSLESDRWKPHGTRPSAQVMATSSRPESETWLISPSLKLQGIIEPQLKIEHVVKNPNWERFEVFVSTDYQGQDPREATWKKLEFTDPAVGDNWTDLNDQFTLDDYLGKDIVFAFRYTAKKGEDNGVWQIKSASIMGRGDAILATPIKFSYKPEKPAPAPVVPDANDPKVVYQNDITQGLSAFSVSKSELTAADWFIGEYNQESYYGISGFTEKNNGSAFLITPEIDLSNRKKVAVQLDQVINFYDSKYHSRHLVALKVALAGASIQDKSAWELIEFTRVPTGASWDRLVSDWVQLPEKFQGKKIQLALQYSSDAQEGVFPNWQLYYLSVMERE
jgi:hypothetical protein